MNFTFGVVTSDKGTKRVVEIIQSIYKQMIDNFEIIIVGGHEIEGDFIKHIPFDATEKSKWITRMKNFITENAEYDNIVFLHDYIKLLPSWYRGFREFGDDWDICMTKMLNLDDTRYRDWCVWADKDFINDPEHNKKCGVESNVTDRVLVPYTYDKTDNMYISGAYWIVKKYVMEECPLDETLVWGEGEDVEWTKRVLLDKKYRYKMNTNSSVKLMKKKDVHARTFTT